MKIVLFGEDFFTAAAFESLLDHGHEIAAVICPVYSCNLEYRGLQKAAEKNNIPFIHEKDINSDKVKVYLQDLCPDLIVCVHLRKILRDAIFSIPKKGAINVHPSLLPKYRGLSPQHQALLNGDRATGVTIHFIDEGIDTGAIIIQKKIPLSGETYIYDLQMELLAIYKQLIPEALGLIDTKNFKPVQQDAAKSPYYGPLKDRDREIDLKKTTFEIHNLIRAVSKPYKGARYGNMIIWTALVEDPASQARLIKEFPEIGIHRDKDRLIIRLHDGSLVSDDFETTTEQQ